MTNSFEKLKRSVCVCVGGVGGNDFWWWLGDKSLVRGESSGGIFLDGRDEQVFSWWGETPPIPSPSRENSAVRKTKLGHKTRQNYNRLDYKMYCKSAIIQKNRIFPYFQNKSK